MSSAFDRPVGTRPGAAIPAAGAEPLFDAQRLDVYRAALEFQTLSVTLLPARGQAALRDQLDRVRGDRGHSPRRGSSVLCQPVRPRGTLLIRIVQILTKLIGADGWISPVGDPSEARRKQQRRR
jgi:hypothetical protein